MKIQCGYRKVFSTKYFLAAIIEKWKQRLGKGFSCVALLTNVLYKLSKAYEALNVMKNYLSDRTHRTKMIDSYSSILDLLIGVLQCSMLGSLLFNTHICDIFTS